MFLNLSLDFHNKKGSLLLLLRMFGSSARITLIVATTNPANLKTPNWATIKRPG